MDAYYGTKRVEACVCPGTEGGYNVRYEDGHTSWSPKAAFEAAYQPETAMSFSGALAALKAGRRVARAGSEEQSFGHCPVYSCRRVDLTAQ